MPEKARANDFHGRFREIVSDPLNIMIDRVPMAGTIDADRQVILHNGLRVPSKGPNAYYGDFSEILIVNRGVHEPLEELAFQEVLRRLEQQPIMIELGAYWAHYSMWMKAKRPGAKCVMVEPDDTIAVGESNFRRNRLDGEFIKQRSGNGDWELDRFIFDRRMERLSILHVDIQGAEVELLEHGAVALGEQQIDHLFISTHGPEIHATICEALSSWGYRIEVDSDTEHTTSYDGFVYASAKHLEPTFRGFAPKGRVDIAHMTAADTVRYLAELQAALAVR